MTRVPPGMWRSYASRLTDDLVAAGEVTDSGWAEAFATVPRHHFTVADHVVDDGVQGDRRRDEPPPDLVGLSGWLARIYSRDRAVVTDMSETDPWGNRVVTTESPPPALAARPLLALELRRGMRVLELGTGTGHMTALMARRVGDVAVRSVDIDLPVRDRAARLLAELQMHPDLVAGDAGRLTRGEQGFDRIVVGFTSDHVPASWIRQLRPGGLMVVRLGWPLGTARHVVLQASSTSRDALCGRFTPWCGAVPPYRPPAGRHVRRSRPYLDSDRTRSGSTFVDPVFLGGETPLTLMAQSRLGGGTARHVRTDGDNAMATFLRAADGSWAEISHRSDRGGRRDVRSGGPTGLVAALEEACVEFADLAHRDWPEFGISIRAGLCRLWHSDPQRGPSWVLSARGSEW